MSTSTRLIGRAVAVAAIALLPSIARAELLRVELNVLGMD
jgi:hypothetical protein